MNTVLVRLPHAGHHFRSLSCSCLRWQLARTPQSTASPRCDLDTVTFSRSRSSGEDRLDGRIDTATYDTKATAIRAQQQQLRQRLGAAEAAALAPISEAVDLVALTSRTADLFREQPAVE